jgi:hypothetical protein
MKLVGPAMPAELCRDLIDPLGDQEHRPVGGLCEEIAQRPLQAPGQYHALAILGNEGK